MHRHFKIYQLNNPQTDWFELHSPYPPFQPETGTVLSSDQDDFGFFFPHCINTQSDSRTSSFLTPHLNTDSIPFLASTEQALN